MKLRHSIPDRRKFLLSLLGGWMAALGATLAWPVTRFLVPPPREPDEVLLPLIECQQVGEGDALRFAWGSKPGLLVRRGDQYLAFVAVCTHLDCNVSWVPGERRFFCACHEGWYDEDGINIAGPPPSPLPQLAVEIRGDALVVRRPGSEA